MWGLDLIGPMPTGTNGGAKHAIVAVDYFTKWAEAEALVHITEANTTSFVKKNIIYRFEIPSIIIITDNGTQFDNRCLNSAPPPVEEGTGTDSGGIRISGATAPRGSLAVSASRGALSSSFTTERDEGVPRERATGSEGSPTFSLPLRFEWARLSFKVISAVVSVVSLVFRIMASPPMLGLVEVPMSLEAILVSSPHTTHICGKGTVSSNSGGHSMSNVLPSIPALGENTVNVGGLIKGPVIISSMGGKSYVDLLKPSRDFI
ncbi:hypothetical protein LWI29_029696 [Acer saccharum]|uniref:Integrase catalytic domain-containing protein n=1 Tax=Acer saccharum TaxID=4024 RepID=A0AA39S4S2_ACESA|nr:hypothetical protein LWI29_029696 [Acer saccharum]